MRTFSYIIFIIVLSFSFNYQVSAQCFNDSFEDGNLLDSWDDNSQSGVSPSLTSTYSFHGNSSVDLPSTTGTNTAQKLISEDTFTAQNKYTGRINKYNDNGGGNEWHFELLATGSGAQLKIRATQGELRYIEKDENGNKITETAFSGTDLPTSTWKKVVIDVRSNGDVYFQAGSNSFTYTTNYFSPSPQPDAVDWTSCNTEVIIRLFNSAFSGGQDQDVAFDSITVVCDYQLTDPTGASATPQTICPGQSSDIQQNGGSVTGTATWEWYDGSSCGKGNKVGTGSSINVTPGDTTTYHVWGVARCDTTACQSVTVNVKDTSTISSTNGPLTICPGQDANPSVSGDLGTGASWEWYDGGSCGNGTNFHTGPNPTVSPATDQTYYVRAEGDCDTSSCLSVSVTVSDTSTSPVSSSSGVDTTCTGNSVNLWVNGGSLGSSAIWQWYSSSCTGGTAVGTGDTITVTPSSTTTYYVRAEGTCDTTDCASKTIYTISTPPAPPTPVGKDTVCANEAGVVYTIDSVPGATNYQWAVPPGATITSGQGDTAITVDFGSTVDSVSVQAENNCGTSSYSTLELDFTSSIAVDDSIVSTTCYGSSDGKIHLTVTQGKAPYTFNWASGDTTAFRTGLSAGDYQVTVTDAGSCKKFSSTYTVPQPDSLSLTFTTSDESCPGNQDGAIDLTVSGGTMDYGYLWMDGDTTQDRSGLSAGTYVVTVTDANNCTASDSVAVSVNQNKQTTIDTSICQGQSYFAGGQQQTTAGTYYDTLSTANNCDSIIQTSLTVESLPNVDAGTDQSITKGESTELNASGGTTYQWAPKDGLASPRQATTEASPKETTTYQVEVTNANDCRATDTVQVKVEEIASDIVIPNAFSPNGDGLNDTFKPKSKGVKDFTMKIFNRWGEKVFESNTIDKGWNGRYKGSEAAAGTYVYTVYVTFEDGSSQNHSGSVTLLR